MPYVRSVSVDRAFPHTLAVTVRVEHPSMVVTVGKSDYLVSPDGRVLEVRSKAPAGLPAVSLPAGTTLLVGSTTGDANVRAALSVLSHTPTGFGGRVGRITKLTADSGTVSALVGTHINAAAGDARRPGPEAGRRAARDAPDHRRSSDTTCPTSTCPRRAARPTACDQPYPQV